MGIIGITQNKYDELIKKISRVCIYAWFVVTLLLNLLFLKDFSVMNLLISFVASSLIFLPLYLVLYSYTQNKNIKYRIIISLISMFPFILSYYCLTNAVKDINFLSLKALLEFLIIFMLSFSFVIKKNSYIYLVLFNLFNALLLIVIYLLYNMYFLEDESVIESLLFMFNALSLNIAFLYHLGNLILEVNSCPK